MIKLSNSSGYATPSSVVEFEGEKIFFSIVPFNRSMVTPIDIYRELTEFWNREPIEVQRKIFEIYKNIRYSLDNTPSKIALKEELENYCGELFQYLNMDKLDLWVRTQSSIRAPQDLADNYVENINDNRSEGKTYTKSQYLDLACLSLTLRAFVPVFGEYIHQVKSEVGNKFKEKACMELLYKGELKKTKPYKRLMNYIEEMLKNEKNGGQNILSGISTEDYPYHVMCLTAVRKLSFVNLTVPPGESVNLLTVLYKSVIGSVRNTGGQNINEKKPKEGGGDDESKMSVLEQYKNRTNISVSEIMELENSVSDPYRILSSLSPTTDPAVLEDCLRRTRPLGNVRISDVGLRIAQWVLQPYISPRGMMFLSKKTIISLLAVTETILVAREHKYLACLVTAHPLKRENGISINASESKTRIPAEMIEELISVFPINKPTNSKRQNVKEEYYILTAIDRIVNETTQEFWKPLVSDKVLKEVFGSLSRRFVIKPDIKISFAKLVLELGKKTQST